jgi:hypothetical protein
MISILKYDVWYSIYHHHICTSFVFSSYLKEKFRVSIEWTPHQGTIGKSTLRKPLTCHWRNLSHNVVSGTPRLSGIRTHISSNRHWLHKEQLMNQNTILIMIVVGIAVVIFLIVLYCFQQRQRTASRARLRNQSK